MADGEKWKKGIGKKTLTPEAAALDAMGAIYEKRLAQPSPPSHEVMLTAATIVQEDIKEARTSANPAQFLGNIARNPEYTRNLALQDVFGEKLLDAGRKAAVKALEGMQRKL